jgi:two-component sensor histidine kinase/ligand-binding sensor domain-containing protein
MCSILLKHLANRIWVSLLFLLSSAAVLQSQTYNFKTYSLDEGLSQSEISDILEDSRGYLWIGTKGGGICKFDGKEFQAFDQKDGLSGQLITGIAEDKKGNIWVSSTWGGISFYNGKKFTSITHKNGLPGDHFDHIIVDEQNNIILFGHGAIYVYDGKKSRLISDQMPSLSGNDVTSVYKDNKGNIWIGTSNGMYALKGQILYDFKNNPLLNQGEIKSITGDNDGNIWCLKSPQTFVHINSYSSYLFNNLKAEIADSIVLPKDAQPNSIHMDKRLQLWVTTANNGIYKLAKGHFVHFDASSGLPINAMRTIYEDHSGCFWIGTSGGGLVKFMDQTFTYYENLPGFKEGDVFALAPDKTNAIWCSSIAKGLFRFDGKTTTEYNTNKELHDFTIRSIYCDKKGMMWFGGPGGIKTWDNNQFKPFKLEDTLQVNVSVFQEDSYGKMWVGSRGQGLFRIDGKKVEHWGAAEGLMNPFVYSIEEDNQGNIWLGTGNGVYKFANGKFRQYGAESGICNPYIGSMVKDKFGHIWMGTDNCVVMFNGSSFQSISTQEGLSSGTIYLLNQDDYGNIWVGTNKGVDEIILNSNGQIKMIRNFGKSEGFRGIECNSRSTCLDNSGNLWFGTVKGVIRYNPREERDFDELPSVHISKIRLFYENTDWTTYTDSVSSWDYLPVNVALPDDKNHITFDFKAINKTAPDNIKYRFMLKGFDIDWSPEVETPFATYSNLPPGNYVFRVKAANKRDGWNEVPAEFSFRINKPYYETWWFVSLCLLMAGSCIYAYNQFRKKKQQAERDSLETVIQLRTAELIKQKEEKEVLLKEIHHRVKNNLQVINSLISIQSSFIEDQKSLDVFEECKNRIRAIALIHEKLYNSEDFGRINIKDYIQMLVQNMIETYNIDKKISLILDLKIEHLNLNTTVPLGLLLNEIISNSLKYAFTDLDKGEIIIRLNTVGDTNSFVLIIGDNGQGYEGNPFGNDPLNSLGLELVKILAEQLNGHIEKIPMDGTYYKMIFHSLKN